MITPGTSVDEAIENLTRLPESLQKIHGTSNFIRSLPYHGNARKLIEQEINPLVEEGRAFHIDTGYVDRSIYSCENFTGVNPLVTQFAAAVLIDVETGEVIEVSLSEDQIEKNEA